MLTFPLDESIWHLVLPVKEVGKLNVVNEAISINITVIHEENQEFWVSRKIVLNANFPQIIQADDAFTSLENK